MCVCVCLYFYDFLPSPCFVISKKTPFAVRTIIRQAYTLISLPASINVLLLNYTKSFSNQFSFSFPFFFLAFFAGEQTIFFWTAATSFCLNRVNIYVSKKFPSVFLSKLLGCQLSFNVGTSFKVADAKWIVECFIMVKINCCNNDDDVVVGVGNERRRFPWMTRQTANCLPNWLGTHV